MPRSMAQDRSIRAVLGLVLGLPAWSLTLAVPPGKLGGAASGRDVTVVTYDLVGAFPDADAGGVLSKIDFLDASERRYTTSGWLHYPVPHHRTGIGLVGARSAVVDVPIVRPASLTVALDVLAPRALGLSDPPRQMFEVHWNGRWLTNVVLSNQRKVYSITVPADRQHHGVNRLELIPLYWVRPRETGASRDARSIASVLESISFSYEPPLPAPEEMPHVQGGRIVQPPNTVITYACQLYSRPVLRLSGSLRLAPGVERSGVADAEVVLTLLDRSGKEHVLLREALDRLIEAGGRLRLEKSLVEHEREPVLLSMSFTSPQGALPGISLGWRGTIVQQRRRAPTVSAARSRWNVLVVLFDTLRADHTSPYGGPIPTPHIQRLADQGVVFAHAYANSAWTRPSVTSILTGTYPATHGTLTNHTVPPDDLVLFPERLREEGYRTLAVSHNGNFSKALGFDRGFDSFVEIFRHAPAYLRERRRGPEALATWYWESFIKPFLDGGGDRPFLVYVHAIDPHHPYDAPQPYGGRFLGQLRGNRWRTDTGGGTGLPVVFQLVNSGLMRMSDQDIEFLKAQYDGEVAYMDDFLGDLLSFFERGGWLDNTLVVFLSDHGEGFLEHGSLGHGVDLYDTTLHVPLIVVLPRELRRQGRVERPVELVDVAPTILDLVGAKPLPQAQGRSLLADLLAGSDAGEESPTFAMHRTDEGYLTEQVSVRLGRWKLVREQHAARAYRTELYDTRADPSEKLDHWAVELVRGKALEQLLRKHLRTCAAASPGAQETNPEELDEDTLKNLRGLGYID